MKFNGQPYAQLPFDDSFNFPETRINKLVGSIRINDKTILDTYNVPRPAANGRRTRIVDAEHHELQQASKIDYEEFQEKIDSVLQMNKMSTLKISGFEYHGTSQNQNPRLVAPDKRDKEIVEAIT